MLKHLENNGAILAFSAGLFSTTLVVGFMFIYGLGQII